MRLLADENLPRAAVFALRDRGYDLLWVREACAGASDPSIVELAIQEKRIILTFDKDFGQLVIEGGRVEVPGVILLRIAVSSAKEVATTIERVITSRSDWEGHFSVIEDERIRMRPLHSG